MTKKRIARIGDKGTKLPKRLAYAKNPAVLARVGADVTAAVWGCEWSPTAQAYLQTLDIPQMMRQRGLRNNRRDIHMAGFGVNKPTDIDQQIYRVLKCFPRTEGYLAFARELRTKLKTAVAATGMQHATVSFLARGAGAWGVLHTDGNPLNLPDQRRLLLTLPTSSEVRGTILDATENGLPPLSSDGQLFGLPEDKAIQQHLAEMRAGDIGIWNMSGRHQPHVHAEPAVKVKPHQVALIARRDGLRPELLRPKRNAPLRSDPRLTLVVTPVPQRL